MIEIMLVSGGALIGLIIGGLLNAADHHRRQLEILQLYDELQELGQALEERTAELEALGSDFAEVAGDEIHLRHLLNRVYEGYLEMGSPKRISGACSEAVRCGFVATRRKTRNERLH
jgi:hypothetical protein